MELVRQSRLKTGSGSVVTINEFPLTDYALAYKAMFEHTQQRAMNSERALDHEHDQIWLIQHPPVYTQGTACSQTPLLQNGIPVVQTDRGGQITYHGPGQIVMYPLLNLKTHNMGVKALVSNLEQSVIELLQEYQVSGARRKDAPGVYVNNAKIAALGLRIRRASSYHGLSFNVDMDLTPFSNIDPCGYQGLEVTQLRNFVVDQEFDFDTLGIRLAANFMSLF